MAELTKRPITALASGLCICAPVEVESAIGIKPKLATNTVINTGRSRRRAPGITASPNSDPAWLCEVALEIARQMGTNAMIALLTRFLPVLQSGPRNRREHAPSLYTHLVRDGKLRKAGLWGCCGQME